MGIGFRSLIVHCVYPFQHKTPIYSIHVYFIDAASHYTLCNSVSHSPPVYSLCINPTQSLTQHHHRSPVGDQVSCLMQHHSHLPIAAQTTNIYAPRVFHDSHTCWTQTPPQQEPPPSVPASALEVRL